MALANRALFGSRFEENNRPGIEMNVDGSMEVVLPDGSRFALDGGGASFPPEWTVGAEGSLVINGAASTDDPLFEVRAPNFNGLTFSNDGSFLLPVVEIGPTGDGFIHVDSGEFRIGSSFTNRDLAVSDAGVVKVAVAAGSLGFYGATPVAKQTGVAVTAAAIHAALINLGLIAA